MCMFRCVCMCSREDTQVHCNEGQYYREGVKKWSLMVGITHPPMHWQLSFQIWFTWEINSCGNVGRTSGWFEINALIWLKENWNPELKVRHQKSKLWDLFSVELQNLVGGCLQSVNPFKASGHTGLWIYSPWPFARMAASRYLITKYYQCVCI